MSRVPFNQAAANKQSFSIQSPWTMGSSWAPEESTEFALDPTDEWYDKVLEADIADVMDILQDSFKKKEEEEEAESGIGASACCFSMN